MSLFGQKEALQALQALLVAGTTSGTDGTPVTMGSGPATAAPVEHRRRFFDGVGRRLDLGERDL